MGEGRGRHDTNHGRAWKPGGQRVCGADEIAPSGPQVPMAGVSDCPVEHLVAMDIDALIEERSEQAGLRPPTGAAPSPPSSGAPVPWPARPAETPAPEPPAASAASAAPAASAPAKPRAPSVPQALLWSEAKGDYAGESLRAIRVNKDKGANFPKFT